MGSHGPVPKRSDQRRRTNQPETPTKTAPGAPEVEVPDPDPDWHPVAARWFKSLGKSGQSRFYEPSDWATAFLVAESMSRDLGEQVVGIVAQGPKAGEVVLGTIPLKGASLSAYLRAMTVLLVTEGDRRRLQIELEKPKPEDPDQARALATVTDLKTRLSG